MTTCFSNFANRRRLRWLDFAILIVVIVSKRSHDLQILEFIAAPRQTTALSKTNRRIHFINSAVFFSLSASSSSNEGRNNNSLKSKSSHSANHDLISTSPELYSVDVRYNRRAPLTYDPTSGRYLDVTMTELPVPSFSPDVENSNLQGGLFQQWSQFFLL